MRDQDKPFTVILTQPKGSLKKLVDALNVRGLRAFHFPLLRLMEPPSWQQVDETWQNLTKYACIIFVSPYAVKTTLKRWWKISKDKQELNSSIEQKYINQGIFVWTDDLLRRFPPVGLMGITSWSVCCSFGLQRCIFLLPNQLAQGGLNSSQANLTGSESLWPSLEKFFKSELFFNSHTIRVALLRGGKGRDWLTNRLTAIGLHVDEIISYKREFLKWSDDIWEVITELMSSSLTTGGTHSSLIKHPRAVFFFSSTDAMRHFVQLVSDQDPSGSLSEFIRKVPCVVTHARLAEEAKKNNFCSVQSCSASIDELCEAFLRCRDS